VIAGGAIGRAQTELGDGGEEEAHADDLHEHGPGLLDAFAVFGFGRFFAGAPKAHGGDFDFAAGAIKEIERQHGAADCSEESRELAETEVKKEHLLEAFGVQERAEDGLFDGHTGGKADVTTALAHGQFPDGAGVVVERFDVGGAGFVVKIQFYRFAGLGVFEFEFSVVGGLAILVAPEVDDEEFVAEVGEVLDGFFAGLFVEEIGD